MDLTLHHCRLLVEVASRGTISAAADALGYTPSAISQQLAGLEQACGVPVLVRTGRNVRLTDAGRELVVHAQGLLDAAEAALTAVARVDTAVEGTVEVAVYESVAASLLPELCAGLRRQHPGLILRTRQMDPDDALDRLGRGDIDLAFTIDYRHAPAQPRPEITSWIITVDCFHVVVAEGDPLRGPVGLAELAERDFIASPPDISCGRCVVTACRSAGFEPRIVHALDDYPTTLRLVAAGQGVALIPDLGLIDPPPGLRILELAEPLTRNVELSVRTASATRPAYVAIRDQVIEVVDRLALARRSTAA